MDSDIEIEVVASDDEVVVIPSIPLIKGETGSPGQPGEPGATGNGISSIEKIATSDLTDTYRITYTNGQTFDYDVVNGKDGDPGEPGEPGQPGTTDYTDLTNKPSINNVTVSGSLSLSDLGIQEELTAGSNVTINNGTISATDTTYTAGSNVQISSGVISATDTTYSNATTSTAGLMSATDKTKLDGVDSNFAHSLTISMNTTTNELTVGINDKNGTPLDVGIVDLDDLGYATQTDLNTKVDKVTGKGLSTNDYSNEEKSKVETLTNELSYVSGEGEEITLQDTANIALRSLQMKGNTMQDDEPTPSSPQPVKSVTGSNEIIIRNSDNTKSQTFPLNFSNKNLFNDTIRSGVTVYNTGVYMENAARLTSTKWTRLKAGTYTISMNTNTSKTLKISNITFDTSGAFYDITGISGQWKTLPMTFTTPVDLLWKMNIMFDDGSNILTSNVSEIQVEEGSTNTPYEEHYQLELNLLDYIYKSGEKWFKKQYMKKLDIPSNVTWTYESSYGDFVTTELFSDILDKTSYSSTTTADVLSNRWTPITYSEIIQSNVGIAFLYYNNTFYSRFSSPLTTVNDFKDWLDNNDVYVLYLLATPIDVEITNSDLKAQLNAIDKAFGYEGETVITSTQDGDTAPMYFNVSAYKDSDLFRLLNKLALENGNEVEY